MHQDSRKWSQNTIKTDLKPEKLEILSRSNKIKAAINNIYNFLINVDIRRCEACLAINYLQYKTHETRITTDEDRSMMLVKRRA